MFRTTPGPPNAEVERTCPLNIPSLIYLGSFRSNALLGGPEYNEGTSGVTQEAAAAGRWSRFALHATYARKSANTRSAGCALEGKSGVT